MCKPARDQTKVSAVRSCGSLTDANLGNAGLLSTRNASGMPTQTQAAHLLSVPTVRHSPIGCRCVDRKIVQAGGAAAGGAALAFIARA